MPALTVVAFSGSRGVLANRMYFTYASVWMSIKGVRASEGGRQKVERAKERERERKRAP